MRDQYPEYLHAARCIATLLHEAAIARKHGWTDMAAELEQRASVRYAEQESKE